MFFVSLIVSPDKFLLRKQLKVGSVESANSVRRGWKCQLISKPLPMTSGGRCHTAAP